MAALQEDAELEQIVNFLLSELKRRRARLHEIKLNRFASPRKNKRQHFDGKDDATFSKLNMDIWKEVNDMNGEDENRNIGNDKDDYDQQDVLAKKI